MLTTLFVRERIPFVAGGEPVYKGHRFQPMYCLHSVFPGSQVETNRRPSIRTDSPDADDVPLALLYQTAFSGLTILPRPATASDSAASRDADNGIHPRETPSDTCIVCL